jgi:hypothetical protein
MKKIGIVGSRHRECEEKVRELVRSLPRETVVVSGGCRSGADHWAEDEAKLCGLETSILRPVMKGKSRGHFCGADRERNREIAETADIVYAFVADDRKGCTEQTVAYAKKLGKPVVIL